MLCNELEYLLEAKCNDILKWMTSRTSNSDGLPWPPVQACESRKLIAQSTSPFAEPLLASENTAPVRRAPPHELLKIASFNEISSETADIKFCFHSSATLSQLLY